MGSRTVWHFTMSLDGYLADDRGTLDWMPTDAGAAPMGTGLVPQIGAVLTGRRTYDDGVEHGGSGAYGGAFTGPVFVLTHRGEQEAEPPNRFVTGGLQAALATARDAAGDGAVVVFGADVGQQCLDAGELDEVLVHIAPVTLGAGTPAFAGSAGSFRGFDVLERSQPGDLTTLRLAPR